MNPVTHFGQPQWLLGALLAAPLLLLLYWRFDRLQRRRVQAFSMMRATDSAQFAVSRALQWGKRLVMCLAVIAACIALARPLGSMQLQDTQRRGLDILFAFDTSRSMLTPDVKPDRLTRAKLAVEDLLEHLNGDGVGLVAFAGEAFLQAPVTTDYEAFRETLDSLDTHTISVGGTDIASAIRLGESTLALRGDTQKVLVLITDGEDLAGDALLAAQAAARKGTIIFTVGVGTAAGELIPVVDASGATQFVKDPQGNFVKSHLDSDALKQIAAATGGVYLPLSGQEQPLVKLYDERLKDFAQRQHADRQVAVYAELFQWPLGVAIALLVLEWLLGASVRRRATDAAPVKAAIVALGLMGLAMPVTPLEASPLSAQQEYNQGHFPQAQRDYAQSLKSDPAQSQLQYNLGAAAYKAGDYPAAAAAFSNALKTREIPLQQSAYYSLGNTLFRQGEKGVAADPDGTIKTWKQSLGAYDTALQMRPADADAKFNRDVVQRRLEQLQRQQQQKKNQNQNQKSGQDKQDNKNPQDQPKDQKGGKESGKQDPQSQQSPQKPGQPGQGGQQKQDNPQGSQSPKPSQGQDPNQSEPHDHDSGQQPQPQPAGPTQPRADQAKGSAQSGAAQAQDIGKPDQMSKLEAQQLLDSTKGSERHLAIGTRNGKPEHPAGPPLKDW